MGSFEMRCAAIGTTSPRRRARLLSLACAAVASATLMGGCGDGSSSAPAPSPAAPLTCDASLATAFKPDANTNVVLVRAYRQGDNLALSGTTGTPPTAAADLCLVKMVVGPGFADASASAPSSSSGIGIEVWLPTPTAWNSKIHNLGGGGWAGGTQASTTLIGNLEAAATAGTTGYVVGSTDTGHAATDGSFAMRQDGGINSALWADFAERSLHELAVKTKALTQAYYGRAQTYAYWDGCSTGGRQGYKIAQEHPDDYDGYVLAAPAINWTKFITNELYPQVVMQRDLPAPLSSAKLAAISGAAVSACDVVAGQHLGFIPDPSQCRYNPTKDATVLCSGVQGNGGVVGTSVAASCVSLAEATAFNKIWYGQTADGSVPDPLLDNASSSTLAGNQLWWGLTRGSDLSLLAGPPTSPPFFGPFPIATDMVALELQDPTYGTPGFLNGTGNGTNKWNQMTYIDLTNAYYQGIALQPFFGNINTDNPDLRKARDAGRKIISYHGLADTLITPAGSVNYYNRVSQALGGNVEVNKFNRLFMVPGMGHCVGVGTAQGTSFPVADANSVPLPAPTQFFDALVNWVEHGNAPASLVLNSANSSVSMPVCPYPQKATYNGTGSPTAAASYTCR